MEFHYLEECTFDSITDMITELKLQRVAAGLFLELIGKPLAVTGADSKALQRMAAANTVDALVNLIEQDTVDYLLDELVTFCISYDWSGFMESTLAEYPPLKEKPIGSCVVVELLDENTSVSYRCKYSLVMAVPSNKAEAAAVVGDLIKKHKLALEDIVEAQL